MRTRLDHRSTRAGATAVAVALALTFVAAGCKSSSSTNAKSPDTSGAATATTLPDEGTPQSGGKVVVAVNAETDGWNPGTAQWADAGHMVGSSMMEPLGVFDNDGNVIPWLAQSWSSSDNNQTWTIKLRQGIKFHDGNEMTAEDVKATLDLNRTDGLAQVQFKGVVLSVDVVDRYTVKVGLSFPWAVYPTAFAGQSGYIVPKSMIDAPKRGADQPVGTGPFKFQNWTPDKSLTVTKFTDYWGGPCALADPEESVRKLCSGAGVPIGQRNGPWLDAMEFRPIPDAQQRAAALQAGDVNMISTVRPSDAATFKNDFQVIKDYNSEKTFVMVNTSEAPFNNVHARRAVAFATNSQAIIDGIDAGEGVRRDTSPFSATSPLGVPSDQTGPLSYDTEKAKEELAAYTKDTGETTLSFTLVGLPTVEDRQVLQQLQEQWRQVGIKAEIDTIEQTAYIVQLVGGKYQAALFRNYGYPEPDFDYVFFSKKTAQPPLYINFSRYTSDSIENDLMVGRTTTDRDLRKQVYTDLAKERNQQAIDTWLFNTPYALVADKNIRGLNWFRTYAFGNYDPKPWIGGLWITSGSGASSPT